MFVCVFLSNSHYCVPQKVQRKHCSAVVYLILVMTFPPKAQWACACISIRRPQLLWLSTHHRRSVKIFAFHDTPFSIARALTVAALLWTKKTQTLSTYSFNLDINAESHAVSVIPSISITDLRLSFRNTWPEMAIAEVQVSPFDSSCVVWTILNKRYRRRFGTAGKCAALVWDHRASTLRPSR